MIAANTRDRQFDPDAPDRRWMTDITHIRTPDGFACLAVVIDLYSSRVVSLLSAVQTPPAKGSLQSRQATGVVLWHCFWLCGAVTPRAECCSTRTTIRKFTNMDRASFLMARNPEHSMGCWGYDTKPTKPAPMDFVASLEINELPTLKSITRFARRQSGGQSSYIC